MRPEAGQTRPEVGQIRSQSGQTCPDSGRRPAKRGTPAADCLLVPVYLIAGRPAVQ